MADQAKQVPLNGAYYGPPIPPSKTYHSHGRRSSGCGLCCLLSLLIKIIVTIVIILGIAALVLWLIFRPTQVKFHVVNASLTQFDYTNNTLRYNLALDIAVRNPNKKIGIYYDRFEADAYYDDKWFHSEWVSPFYQGKKNTTMLRPVFKGEIPLLLQSSDFRNGGVFEIDVVLNLRVRFKVGSVKTKRIKPKVNCDLKVPLVSGRGNTNVGAFETERCDVDVF